LELIAQLVDIVLHLDVHLGALIQQYGIWVYAILFLIIFSETGLVVTPFLPGDSLLFVAGTLASLGQMDVNLLVALLAIAAFLGNAVNFRIGRYVGPKVFSNPDARFLRPAYLEKTHRFYERHGGKTVVLSRFLPIIRTYAPFVAGVSGMPATRFLTYNLLGAAAWVAGLTYGGYFFGNLTVVKNNLSLIIVALVILPGLPALIEFLRVHLRARVSAKP
jgi:membrane-associated protein